MINNSTDVSGKCICDDQNKNNWTVVGYEGKYKEYYIISCNICKKQWKTKAKYKSEITKASYLK